MLTRYQTNFASLSPEETALVARHVARVSGEESIAAETGEQLYDRLTEMAWTQAQVILAVAPDPSPEAVVALEKLVGKPIKRELPAIPKQPSAPRPRGASVRRGDPRVVVSLAPNPKRPGSASFGRYALYQIGMTVDEFVAAGGTTADVKWDTEKGFVVLGMPGGEDENPSAEE